MTFKEWLTEILTPDTTEEVKPGLFIQTKEKADGKKEYRVIHPMAWNGKINIKNSTLGAHPLKHLFIFLAIMFIVFGYWYEVHEYKQFYVQTINYPEPFCEAVQRAKTNLLTDGSLSFNESLLNELKKDG